MSEREDVSETTKNARRFVRGGRPGPGRPKGSKSKIPLEWRQGLRDHFLKAETFALLLERIDKDLKSSRHAPTLALKMAAHAFGEPPQDLNLNAGNSLRDALLAAFQRRQGQGPGGTS